MSNAILLAPGPVQLHPTVQKLLAEPMIHHRTPEFDAILKRVLENMKFLFQTKNPVFIHNSSGSGGMESLLVNLLSKDDEVLAADLTDETDKEEFDSRPSFSLNVRYRPAMRADRARHHRQPV